MRNTHNKEKKKIAETGINILSRERSQRTTLYSEREREREKLRLLNNIHSLS